MHIGYFDSQQDAARAYDQEAIRLRGPNTSLNYPITDYDVSATVHLGIGPGPLAGSPTLPSAPCPLRDTMRCCIATLHGVLHSFVVGLAAN